MGIDTEPIDWNDCDKYVDEMVRIAEKITVECTGKDFEAHCAKKEDVATLDAEEELRKGIKHMVRVIWMRDMDWENMVRFISDPNGPQSIEEEYWVEDVTMALKYHILNTTLVFIQIWAWIVTPEDKKKKGKK